MARTHPDSSSVLSGRTSGIVDCDSGALVGVENSMARERLLSPGERSVRRNAACRTRFLAARAATTRLHRGYPNAETGARRCVSLAVACGLGKLPARISLGPRHGAGMATAP